MRITSVVDAAHGRVDLDQTFSSKRGLAPDEATPIDTDASGRPSSGEAGVREVFRGLRAELERRGMEVSFSVDPSSGVAQMVVVESGTGREVVKVPSDTTLYRGLEDLKRSDI